MIENKDDVLENNLNISEEEEIEEEKEATENVLTSKLFDPTKIKMETKTPSLDTLIKRIKKNEIQMDSEKYFQRKDDLWDITKQSRLIESLLIRFPIPAFYFDATNEDEWLVVDGLQRLSSIRNFCVNKSLKLTNLEFLTDLNNKGFDDLSGSDQRTIEESQVFIYKIMPGTPSDVKFNIFKRINTGGLVLEPQEIRHALYQGKPANFIFELAKSTEFLKATFKKIQTNRMLDRDFVNRFLCFYLFGTENYDTIIYGKDLDTFMSNAMGAINTKSDEEINKIREDFKNAMLLANKIFGNQAFRKIIKGQKKMYPINKALFEVISVQFAKLNETERKNLETKKEDFKNGFIEKLNEGSGLLESITISSGDKNRVKKRHEIIFNLINETLNK